MYSLFYPREYMGMSNNIILTNDVVKDIQELIKEIKEECGIPVDSISQGQIFGILEEHCTVIYYPLKNERNRGFHIQRLVKGELQDFVYINTEMTYEQQVFTAAHELGHIFKVYSKVCDKSKKKGIDLNPDDLDYEEKVTDRFAAEFIMPEDVFIKRAEKLEINNTQSLNDLLRKICILMGEFLSPFDAVRKRLYEVGQISLSTNNYISAQKEKLDILINKFKKDENTTTNAVTRVKTISGLREFIHSASKCDSTDKMLLNRLKSDFNFEEIDNLDVNLSEINNLGKKSDNN